MVINLLHLAAKQNDFGVMNALVGMLKNAVDASLFKYHLSTTNALGQNVFNIAEMHKNQPIITLLQTQGLAAESIAGDKTSYQAVMGSAAAAADFQEAAAEILAPNPPSTITDSPQVSVRRLAIARDQTNNF
jgi:hypothetical protein